MPRIRGWYVRAAVTLLGTTAIAMGTHAGPPTINRGGRCVTPQYCPPPYTKDAPPSEQPGRPTDPGTVPMVEDAKPVDPNAPVPPPPDGSQAPQQQNQQPADQAQQPNQPQDQAQPQQNLNVPQANQNLSTASSSGAQSVAPGLIGDLFGLTSNYGVSITDTLGSPLLDSFGDPIELHFLDTIPGGNLAAAPGANVGRQKLTENTSPIPRDRAYVNYSYFSDAQISRGGINVNRITPGFEKTFMDGNMSFELRTPFASTLSSDFTGTINDDQTEFGNMTMYLKALLSQTCKVSYSAGLGVTLPTADDVRLQDATGATVFSVDNQAVHLLPFVGAVFTPNDCLFAQGIIQMDIDPNGNTVRASDFTATVPTPTTRLGRVQDMTYMFVDVSVGYWVYRNQCHNSWINGIAPIVELHYNQSLGNGDDIGGTVGGTVFDFTTPEGLSTTNAVLGVTTVIRKNALLTAGYAVPLYSEDSQFDGEFRLTFNWLFGKPKCNDYCTSCY